MNLFEIPGFSKYLASIDGKIISKLTGKPIRQKFRRDGYIDILVSPDIGPKYKLQLEHRLICKAFHGESTLDVNHKNGIKSDNRPENLEWVTKSQNIKHSICFLKNKHNKSGFENSNSKLTLNQHDQCIRWFNDKVLDQYELAKFFNVNPATIMIHIRKYKSIRKKLCK